MCKTDLRRLPRPLRRIAGQSACVVLLAAMALAQSGDRNARAAQRDGSKLPAGEFTRFVDPQKGISLWRPAGWKYRALPNGGHVFQPEQNAVGLLAATDDNPDGYGAA